MPLVLPTPSRQSKRRFSLGLDVRWRLLGNRNPPLHVVSRQLLRIPVPTYWHKFQLFLAIRPISVALHRPLRAILALRDNRHQSVEDCKEVRDVTVH